MGEFIHLNLGGPKYKIRGPTGLSSGDGAHHDRSISEHSREEREQVEGVS